MARFKKKRFFFLLIFTFSLSFLINPLRKNLIELFRLPLIFNSILLKEIKNFLSYRGILYENISLKKKFDNLQKEYIKLKEEIIGEEVLRELTKFKKEKNFVLSKVIGREPSNWYSSILIDKGRSQGIAEGDCVINQKGLVGRIIEVTKSTSKVILITDPQFSCAGIVQRSRLQGIVYGSLLNKLIMGFFDDEIDAKIDDIVITSSLSTFAPRAILIGKIIEIVSDSGGIKAIIKPSVELGKIEEVLVILKND